jgi:hypothetical protein
MSFSPWTIKERTAAGFLVGFVAASTLVDTTGDRAGQARPPAHPRLTAYETHLSMEAASPFKTRWTFLGPTEPSGRANAIAVVDRGERRRIYAGFSGSGLWRTDDEGATWEPLFTRAASTAIVAVAVSPSNPDVIWLLTGNPARAHIRVSGEGVFKSVDAGRTWRFMGLPDVGDWFGRIVVHPTNLQIVYVAGLGGPVSPASARGIFKSTDGGATWNPCSSAARTSA